MFGNSDGFPFMAGGGPASVTERHPPAIQIIQLWQIYLNNVNPLLKLTHTPTLQERIIEATANIGNVSKSLEALMFAIYFMAITSLNDEEAQLTFGHEKGALLQRYYTACQQALVNGGFMRHTDLTLLQAFLLYLVSFPKISNLCSVSKLWAVWYSTLHGSTIAILSHRNCRQTCLSHGPAP